MDKSARKARLSDHLQSVVNTALDAKGLSAREISMQVVGHDGLIRDIRRGNVPTADKISGLADALDLEFYLGPPRADAKLGFAEASIPIIGWARCGTRGEGPTEVAKERAAPAPIGYDHTAAFYAKAMGHSMRPEGIASGDYALIDPNRVAMVGDRVWVKDIKQLASLKRFTARDDQSCHFRGWLDPADDAQRSFDIEMPHAAIVDLFPVVAVFDGPPNGATPPVLRTDPRADEFRLADSPLRKIAEALDLDPGASQDDILNTILDLKGAAKKLVEISRMLGQPAPLKDRLKKR